MSELPFVKMHGLGNDYVFVDLFRETVADPPALARRISDRHTGVGGDGLILIAPSEVGDARMEMYNADGSRAEMCGNGLRCVARYVHDEGIARKDRLKLETDAGLLEVALRLEGEAVAAVTVDMGPPRLEPSQVPVDRPGPGPLVEVPLEVGDRTLQVTCVSMGNPHCVTFVADADSAPVTELGPLVEHHAWFPNRTNVEFVSVVGPDHLRQRTWERGSGETQACGTGASAVCVAARLTGRTGRRVTIDLLGGRLELDWREADDHVLMTGPAVEVFRGVYPLP